MGRGASDGQRPSRLDAHAKREPVCRQTPARASGNRSNSNTRAPGPGSPTPNTALKPIQGDPARRLSWLGSAEPLYAGDLVVLATYWLVVAAAEEMAFRGILQRRLTRLAGFPAALLLATAAFVLWHGIPAWDNVLAIRIASGLALGLLYHGSRGLLPSILCHWTLNLALVA